VTVRIISGDDPETVAALAKQAGLDYGPESLVSGADLEGKSPEEVQRLVASARIFGRIAPRSRPTSSISCAAPATTSR